MFLRKLEDEELKRIKKSKDAANAIIKTQREKLVAEIKGYGNYSIYHAVDLKLRALEQKLERTQMVMGHPVIVSFNGRSAYVDYDIFNKFNHSLDKSGFWNHNIKIEGASLIIRYTKHGQSGGVELFIPAHQAELLIGLPTIDLEE